MRSRHHQPSNMEKTLFLIAFILFFKTSLFAQNSKTREPQIYAVVVGISSYRDDNIPGLNFADKDAIAFADFLKTPNAGAVPDQNIALLTNEKATRSNIIKELGRLVSSS